MNTKKSTALSSTHDERVSTLSRRAVICGIAVLSLGINPENVIAATGVTVNSSGQLEVSLAANPALKKVGGVITIELNSGTSVALVRTSTSPQGFTALNLACTHQGVTVQQSGNRWVCPAHRSNFALNGKVVKGPATTNLQSFKIKATTKNVVITL